MVWEIVKRYVKLFSGIGILERIVKWHIRKLFRGIPIQNCFPQNKEHKIRVLWCGRSADQSRSKKYYLNTYTYFVTCKINKYIYR